MNDMPFLIRRIALLIAMAAPGLASAQQSAVRATGATPLSLADAVRMAEHASESMRIARAGVDRARGQHMQVRSQLLPQVTGTASYQRTIQSQFEEIAKRTGGSDSADGGGADDFVNSPLARVFASPNTMVLGLSASQMIYSGGRVRSDIAAANAGRRAADLEARAARAQVVFEIAQAYFDAQVAERLLAIADSSFAQTERALQQTQLAREVGNTAEYDLIRARVQRDNTRPAVIAARTRRDVAFLALRQLLNLPPGGPLVLTTSIDNATTAPPAALRAASDLVREAPDTSIEARSVVRQSAENVRAIEEQLRGVRAHRLPDIALTTNYQRYSYPSGVLEDRLKMYVPNWTVSLGLSVPLFTGGRLEGERVVARANLAEAQQRHQQVSEAAALDVRLALAQLEQAEATFAASAGTDEQAARGYAIAEVRFAEGLGTQLELTQTRVELETARANRVQAARDLALARLRMALLRDLPLGGAMTGPAPANAGSMTSQR